MLIHRVTRLGTMEPSVNRAHTQPIFQEQMHNASLTARRPEDGERLGFETPLQFLKDKSDKEIKRSRSEVRDSR